MADTAPLKIDGALIPEGSGPCLLSGTSIATSDGSVFVEDLSIGTMVLTASGDSRPVRWLGHRGIDCSRHPNPAAVWPIRIQAGAFAPSQPARDLWMSRGHSVLVGGVLIQAETLVNGATIVQVPRERVEYWHVELDSHDVLLAEGVPTETYLDVGNRTDFNNGGAYLEAYPEFRSKLDSETCVPIVKDGPVVQKTKEILLARAEALGYVLTDDADVHVIADGRRIDAVRSGAKRLTFKVPAAASGIELRSRSFIPTQINPAKDDPRELGICVARLELNGIEAALTDESAFAHGWHLLEGNADGQHWRWSTGCAQLPAGTHLIVIDIGHSGRCYWEEQCKSVGVAALG
jgi:hypothetical protein